MKNILVTGCAGFIGFHLCQHLLQKKYKVYGVDNLNNYYDVGLKKNRLNILRKTIKTLEDTGLIKSVKINARKWNHTKWYTIDLKKYNSLITMHSESHYTKNEESINLSDTNNNNYTSNVFKLASKTINSYSLLS
jgi:nucleoside-diphosphate-sugar epimerase